MAKSWMFVLSLVFASPLAARDLVVPSIKGWKHAETGLILMSQLAGMQRTSLTDATQDEHDVAAQFETPDKSVIATVYVFHPAISDVGLWFDRSQVALESRDLFRHVAPTTADPINFPVGGSTSPSSLRQVYASLDGRYRSTALAVVPVESWIVTIRISARTLTAKQLDARLRQLTSDIHWPSTGTAATVVAPVTACSTPLKFTKAKTVKLSCCRFRGHRDKVFLRPEDGDATTEVQP